MSQICDYGCGQSATFFRTPSKKVPNGKWCCSKSHLSCPAVKSRRFATNTQKYGSPNVFSAIHTREEFSDISAKMRTRASDQMKDKSRKLGFNNPKILAKANQVFRQKYNVENPMHLNEVKDKVAATNVARYGAPCKVAMLFQYQRSRIADQWLDEINVPEEQRECWIQLKERRIKVDGYDPRTNTVYEFYGDYWHGNPSKFPPNMENKQTHKTMGQLYQNTLDREAALEEHGFKVVSIWEEKFRSR